MDRQKFAHYTTGIKELDDEHWFMYLLIHDVNTAMKENKPEVVRQIIDHLIIAFNLHNAHEEKLMLECGYPFYKAHIEKHPLIVNELARIRNLDDFAITLLWRSSKITEALTSHIDHDDIQFSDFIKKAQ